jgi:FkbM family methyltransferase
MGRVQDPALLHGKQGMTPASGHGIGRLVELLRRTRSSERGRQEAARQQLEQARAAARAWKQRAGAAVVRGRVLRERLTRVIATLRTARQRLEEANRERPSVAVIRDVFGHRVRTLNARVAARSADSREGQLVQLSPSYHAALQEPPHALADIAARIEIDGLCWWVPRPSKTERLPFRTIAQTRDLTGGGIMLDIGANVGRMSIPRVILGDATVAYCAEPDPVTYACLARNVIDNGLRGLVLPDRTAIGDRNGTVRLLRAGSSGNFRVLSDDQLVSGEVVDVPCCTLDTWVRQLDIDLDAVTFIKVDIEGFERRLILGADRVLGFPQIAWQFEVKPSGLRAVGDDPAELYRDLQRAFTHFIDLNRKAAGARVRPVADLPEALRYIEPDQKTDILLFTARGRGA